MALPFASTLDQRFSDAGRVSRRKARLLLGVNLFLAAAVLLLIVVYTIQGRSPLRIGALALLVVVFLVSTALLLRGRLAVAGQIHIYALLLILTALRFVVGDSLYELQSHTAIMALITFDAAMIHVRGRSLLLTSLLALVSLLAVFLLAPVLRPELFSFSDVVGPAILAAVILAVGAFIARALFSLSAGVVEELEGTHNRLNEQYSQLRELFAGIRQGIEISENLERTGGDAARVVASLKEETAASQELLTEFRSALERLKGQTSSLKEQSRSLEEQMSNQSAFVEEATAAVEEMNGSIQSMSRISRERSGQVDTLVRTSEEGAQQMKRSEEGMKAIADSSQRMLSFVQMISKIAAQSNMLAMNAAIEAAHAGQQGAGFAVVADEIRELSETSSSYARQIAEALKGTVAEVEQAGAVNTEAATLFSQIHEGVLKTNDTFQELISGLSELSQGSQEILDSVTQLRETTTQVTEASKSGRELSEGGEKATTSLSEIAERLAASGDRNRETADRLQEVVLTVERISHENKEQIEKLDGEAHAIYDD